MHGLFTLLLILIAVVESSASSSEFCSTVYSDYHRRQLAYFSEDGVFDIEGGAKHVVSFVCYILERLRIYAHILCIKSCALLIHVFI